MNEMEGNKEIKVFVSFVAHEYTNGLFVPLFPLAFNKVK